MASDLGYVNGYDDGSFRPNTPITRAEVAQLINNVLERHVDSADDMLAGMRTFSDNLPGAWYYFALQEATNSHFYDRKPGSLLEIWASLRPNPDWAALERQDSMPGDVVY